MVPESLAAAVTIYVWWLTGDAFSWNSSCMQSVPHTLLLLCTLDDVFIVAVSSSPHKDKQQPLSKQQRQRPANSRCRDFAFETSRGGLLVHKASSAEVDRFQRFARPLFQSYKDPPSPHVTEESWKQSLIQLHSTESSMGLSSTSSVPLKKRSRAPRGGGHKRKRVEEELVWGLEQMIQEEQQRKRKQQQQQLSTSVEEEPLRQCIPNTISVPEDDACALDYLQLCHNGNAAAAELSVLVNVSCGRGE